MDKTKLQANLFLFYIRYKKPIITVFAITCAILIGLNNWERVKWMLADKTPWKLAEVMSGNSFTVTRNNEIKTINLCGIIALEDKSKKYLESLINLGSGEVIFEKIGDRYEAWILLDKGYDTELVSHISDEPDGLIEAQIHLNTWMLERGMVSYDSSSQCSDPRLYANAEKIGKENKLGIWQNK